MSTISNTGGTNAFYEKSLSSIKGLRSQAENLQSQMDTGSTISKSSDNPVVAARLRTLARTESLSKIDIANANRANADLSLAGSTMSDLADAIIQAQTLATQASSSTFTADQRNAIATQLDQLHSNMLALVNARDSSGNALFGGEAAGNAYQVDASGNATYVGTAKVDDLPLGDGQTVTRSMTGPHFLSFTGADGSATDVLATVKALSDALKAGPGTPVVTDALTNLQTGLDTLTTGQTVVGSRLNWIELTSDRRTDMSEMRSEEQANIAGADPATTMVRLQETLNALEYSHATFSKLANLSLFDQLR